MIFYMITSFEINNQELFMFFSSVRSTGGIVLYIPIIQRILCLSSYTHTNRHTHTHTTWSRDSSGKVLYFESNQW